MFWGQFYKGTTWQYPRTYESVKGKTESITIEGDMSSLSVFIAWLVECFIHRDGDTLRIHQRASPWWNNDDLEMFNTYTRRCIYSLSPIKKRSLRLIPWISACKAIFLPLQLLPYVCLLQRVEDNLDIATAPLEAAPTRKSTFQSRRIRTTSMPTSNFSFVYNRSHTTFLDNKEIIFKLLLGGNQIYCEKCRDTHLFHKCGGTY